MNSQTDQILVRPDKKRPFWLFLILAGIIFILIVAGAVYYGLFFFDAKPGVFRRLLYSLVPNFSVVEVIATVVPNPKIIEGYFLDDIEKNPTHRVSYKWTNTYTSNGIVSSTRTGIMPSYHKDLVYFIGNVMKVDPRKRTVDVEIQGDRYTLNLRSSPYYYKPGPRPQVTSSGELKLKPVGRLTDVGVFEIGKIAYFLVYDSGGIFTVISVEL